MAYVGEQCTPLTGKTVSQEQDNRHSYEESVEVFGTGRYQVFVFVLLSLVTWSTSVGNEGYVWLGATMKHTCILPNNTVAAENSTIRHLPSRDQCSYKTLVTYENLTNATLEENRCTKWVYDQTFFKSTIMSEWDLNECNGKWKISLAASIFMIGFLIGCFIFGDLSDRFGRMKMFLVCHVGLCSVGIAAGFSVNLEMLIALRFLFGIFAAGARNSATVYLAEMLKPSLRSLVGPITSVTYGISSVLLTATAQFLGDWRLIQMITSAVCAWFIPYYWFIHESPHWLLVQGKQKQVIDYFKTSAQMNHVHIPEQMEIYYHCQNAEQEKLNYFDFLKTSNMRRITFIICLAWLIVSAVAFGFSYNVGNMTGNIFTNAYITLGASPLVLFSIWILAYGRRLVVVVGLFAMATASVAVAILVSYQHLPGVSVYAIPILCGLGRVLSSYSFGGLYVITAELYPTKLRVSAIGLGSSLARVGGALAPYLALSSDLSKNLPYIIFGIASGIAGLMALSLPETLNRSLPETIEEMEEFYKLRCCVTKKKKTCDLNNKAEEKMLTDQSCSDSQA